jgi:hypothetical protein
MRSVVTALALVSALIASPAVAQTVVPTYTTSTGNTLNAQGTVILNADGSLGGFPQAVTSVTTNGTVTTANTFQSALAASPTRKGCAVYNTSANAELIFLGAPGNATAARSIPLPPGGAFNCGSFQGIVLTDQISITSATVASAYVVVAQ